MLSYIPIALLACICGALASCEPPTAFLPQSAWTNDGLASTFTSINRTLQDLFSTSAFNTSSASIQITSSDHTLFSAFHTASTTNGGATEVDGSTIYRIASNTKIFTALAILQQHARGKIDLDAPITTYIHDLRSGRKKRGNIKWERISIRSLLSHVGGIPDDCALTSPSLTDHRTDHLRRCTRRLAVFDWRSSGGSCRLASNLDGRFGRAAGL
jgi:CubicO group peptidase (beta-lactamase class C family)